MKNIHFLSLSICIFLSISYVYSHQELCADLDSGHRLCTSFTQIDCLLDLQITLNDEILYNQNVTLGELANLNQQTLCPQTNFTCELCFYWEGTAVQSENSAEGCLTLSGDCLNDPLYLGCFNDDNVSLCTKQSQCLNNCSGNGVCQNNGICHCNENFSGDDCSNECKSSSQSIPRLLATSYQNASKENDFLGYIHEDPNLGFLGISVVVTEDTEAVQVYISKSCHPDPDNQIFDSTQSATKRAPFNTILSNYCMNIGGGTWFVLVRCPSDRVCSFSITIREEYIQPLNTDRVVSISAPTNYFSFTATSPGYTIALATEKKLDLSVKLMIGVCPTAGVYLSELHKPSHVFKEHGVTLYKYVFASKYAFPATYYLSVTDKSFAWGSQPVSNAYVISASNGYCPGSSCEFGKCNPHSQCTCYEGFGGKKCDTLLRPPSISSSSDSPSSHSPSSSASSDGLGGWATFGIVSGSIALFVIVIFFMVAIVAVGVFIRKRRQQQQPPADNIYNLLTTETL